MISYKKQNSKKNLPIITIPMPGVQSVTTLVMVNTGSRYEKPKSEGIAHFFEHMVFKGTKNYPGAEKIAIALDEVGADANAFTSKEYTGYYVKAESGQTERAIDLVSDMLLQPLLKQEDIDRERGVIIEEINMYHDLPMRHIANKFEQLFFRGSGLSHDIIGSKETVSSLSSADFNNFLTQWYGLENMVLVVCGDERVVGSDETISLIEDKFSKDHGVRADGKLDVKKFISSKNGPISPHKFYLENRKTEQAHLVIGWPGLERGHEDRYALSVLGTILGGNMSSRLFSEVREKRGLAYYISSDVDFYHDAGIFGASAGVDPKRIDNALEVIFSEFRDLASGEKPISEEELKKAKDYLVGTMTLSLEDSKSVAQFFGMKEILNDDIETPQEVFDSIRAVELDDVNRLAESLLGEGQARLALIGPFEDEDRFARHLG